MLEIGCEREYGGTLTASATHERAWRMRGKDLWSFLGSHLAGRGPKSMGIEDLDHYHAPKWVSAMKKGAVD